MIYLCVNLKKLLHKDMESCFHNLQDGDFPTWIVNPFTSNATDVDVALEKSFIKLQSNTEPQESFKWDKHCDQQCKPSV